MPISYLHLTARIPQSLESIWDDKSPFSVLPRINGSNRSSEHQRVTSSVRNSPYLPQQQAQPISHGINQTGARTLQEIEAEMRAQAARGRKQQQESPQMHHQQPQHHQNHIHQQESDIQFRQLQQQAQLHLLEQQQHIQHQFHHGQQQQLHQRTPPPRMLPQSQSPRFHLHQQQLLLMQQQQTAQQQRFQEMQEQLRAEEMERQLRNQHLRDGHQRQPSGPTIAELQAAQALQQSGRNRSPASFQDQHFPLLNQQNIQHMPHSIQVQQRLLAELAQAEFARDLQSVDPVQQEALRAEAMRKIMETERMEEKRRRRAAKIAHMVPMHFSEFP